jgi:predicted AlkP superfamily pyrophosphatase or phosphodiesterase
MHLYVAPAFVALSLAVALPAVAGPAPVPPTAAEREDVRCEFLADARRSFSERSGDIFFLPKKWNFLASYNPERVELTHLRVGSRVEARMTPGQTHGAPWSYDRDIPLVLWGPGFVKPNQVVRRRTAQQDLVPTYARLIGAPLPEDAEGQVLGEALRRTTRKPRLIFTMVFDQGGEAFYRLHPGATPFVDRLKREGTYFANTRVSHVDMETAQGHIAIGTGAFPKDHGISSNYVWEGGAGSDVNAFTVFTPPAPYMMKSPTLGDFWLRASKNQGMLLSYCWADRAAMGMGGHGSFFKGNKKPFVFWFNPKAGTFETNPAHFALPAYLADATPVPYGKAIAGPDGTWMEHPLQTASDIIPTPAFPRFEADQLSQVFEREPLGQDDVPDLVYVTLKSTDNAGHMYGQESEEAGAILAEQDRQFERLFNQLVKKVGAENIVVALTADHGGPPLPELSGGKRLYTVKFLQDLNARFDKTADGVDLAESVGSTQLWVDQRQMAASHVTLADLKRFIAQYRVDGQPFFEQVLTRDELRGATVAP